jgi:ABC-type phosphate transport system substrate-binding protein
VRPAPEHPQVGIGAIVNSLNPISRLSEKELREIFSGAIVDWSQLGEPHLLIVPILPDASSDEETGSKAPRS